MSDEHGNEQQARPALDSLALHVHNIEQAMYQENYEAALKLMNNDIFGTWFGMHPSRLTEVVGIVSEKFPGRRHLVAGLLGMFSPNGAEDVDDANILAKIDIDDHSVLLITVFSRMLTYRAHGYTKAALEQAQTLELHMTQQKMQPMVNTYDGVELQFSVHQGVTAMLAGDFTRALTYFTRAQLQSPILKFMFLTRDAMVKSALIHAAFGNHSTAKSLLERAGQVQRTSSWVESHIDVHAELATILLTYEHQTDSLQQLDAIALQDVGELWPFYILATYRILDFAGRHDELHHRMQMFEQMPFLRVERQGLPGSIIPLKNAIAALRNGIPADAQIYLDHADLDMPFIQVFQAAIHVYAGRTQQAIQLTNRLYSATRGLQRMEIRRLAVLAAAQYQAENTVECVETLTQAAKLIGTDSDELALMFSPETRELAAQHIATWPTAGHAPSMFLTGLPRPGLSLTDREIEIVRQLAKGLSRAQLAKDMFISVNTLKTHLQSIYRKFGVSTAADAVRSARRRSLL